MILDTKRNMIAGVEASATQHLAQAVSGII
jgi:hypothetical protein